MRGIDFTRVTIDVFSIEQGAAGRKAADYLVAQHGYREIGVLAGQDINWRAVIMGDIVVVRRGLQLPRSACQQGAFAVPRPEMLMRGAT